jgi:hypothetical protein
MKIDGKHWFVIVPVKNYANELSMFLINVKNKLTLQLSS